MDNIIKHNAVVGQSGGPTAAINATLSGVIRGCIESGRIGMLYGAKNGIDGILARRFASLFDILPSDKELHELEMTPSAALGSCRKKLPDPHDSASRPLYEKIFDIFEELDIKYLFYIGGNDSMDTVYKLSLYAKANHKELYAVGVPKTIDNDLVGTDHTPGYGSAAKFIAASISEIARDLPVYDLKSVVICEIMGRDAGWLTAAAALPRAINPLDAPDLVYLPEVSFDTENFINRTELLLKQKNSVLIAVSEGIRDKDGKYISAQERGEMKDAFGHKYLSGTGKTLEMIVRERIGCKVRSIEFNLLQRCASHIASLTDITEAVLVGRTAAAAGIKGETGKFVALVRTQGDKYSCVTKLIGIEEVANKIKKVPAEFITPDGSNVTDTCVKYLLPLIAGEVNLEYVNGMPKHFIIK
ncbi:MAG: 6-phosphofructokinase [Oscillospiraceae bacterium]|nr:6-phosphofructokinase [Oscillospiraceae bacterium]